MTTPFDPHSEGSPPPRGETWRSKDVGGVFLTPKVRGGETNSAVKWGRHWSKGVGKVGRDDGGGGSSYPHSEGVVEAEGV